MKIFVKAKPKNKRGYVKRVGEVSFIVAVKEVPEKGRANQAIIKALAEFLKLSTPAIVFVSGQTSKQKVFEIPLTLEDLDKILDTSGQIKLL